MENICEIIIILKVDDILHGDNLKKVIKKISNSFEDMEIRPRVKITNE